VTKEAAGRGKVKMVTNSIRQASKETNIKNKKKDLHGANRKNTYRYQRNPGTQWNKTA